jgi:serine/threonine protein kinase
VHDDLQQFADLLSERHVRDPQHARHLSVKVAEIGDRAMETRWRSEDPLIGVCLDGRYRITGLLGRGGMGLVYEGTHEQLGRAVAIKVLGPDMATDPIVVERFLREARIASSLGHGNIVDVSDLGRLQDGRPYLVMPRIDGVDLATLLQYERTFPPARVAELLSGVAAALDLVHAKGLAHRDVKPENLMHVLREDGSEAVMLTDFGIVGLIDVKTARLTAESMVCGTPAYVAPELVATGEFDQRADVYALATVAFEMLTGRLPFDDDRPTRILSAKVERPAPSLAAAANRLFAQPLEHVIARGLARDPEQRFQSAGAFVAALQQAAPQAPPREDIAAAATLRNLALRESGGPAVHAARNSAQAGKFARSLKLTAALAAIALLGSWFASRSLTRPASKPPEPRRPVVASNAPPHFAPAPEPPKLTPHEALPAPQRTGDPPPPPAERPSARPTLTEPQAPSIAVSRRVPRTSTLHTPLASPPPTPSIRPDEPGAEALNRAANQELLQGRLGSALELFERASQRDPRSQAAYRGLAVVNERLGRRAEAAQAYRRALELQPQGSQADALRARLQRIEAAH